jgi:hypothetical protein
VQNIFYLIILSFYLHAKIGTKAKVEIPNVLFLLSDLIFISLPALSFLIFDLIYYFKYKKNKILKKNLNFKN